MLRFVPRAAVVFVAPVLALVVAACPPPPPPPPPDCGVTNVAEETQALAIFIPQAFIQLVLEGGDVCTPGTADGCADAFDACDVDVGDVAVASVQRETVFVGALNSPVTLFDVRIEGSCPDVYVENFFAGTFVAAGTTLPLTLVVNPTTTGPCEAQLVIDTDATNAVTANTGLGSISVDVVVNRVAGGAEGCAPAVACCCDFASVRLPAQCQTFSNDADRLTCADPTSQQLLFTDQCDFTCGEARSTAWLRAFDEPLTFGPVRVGDDGDVVVLHPAPCTVERITADGATVWSMPLSALTSCEDITLAGVVLVVTGDGTEVLVDATSGIEGATRSNEGPTVTARAGDGALTASRRASDLVVRRTNTIGAVTSSFELLGVQPDLGAQHFVAALASGDVVVSFARAAGAPAVDVPSAAGGVFTLGDADYAALLQVDAAGLVRRAFVLQSSSVANVDAHDDAYVMCGATQASGALVELGEAGAPAVVRGELTASRGFHVIVDGDIVALDVDASNQLTSVCSFTPDGRVFVLATSNTAFTLRGPTFARELMQGRAVGMGALLDDEAVVVVGVHGGIAGQELLPLYPPGLTPLESGSFLYRVPLTDFGL